MPVFFTQIPCMLYSPTAAVSETAVCFVTLSPSCRSVALRCMYPAEITKLAHNSAKVDTSLLDNGDGKDDGDEDFETFMPSMAAAANAGVRFVLCVVCMAWKCAVTCLCVYNWHVEVYWCAHCVLFIPVCM